MKLTGLLLIILEPKHALVSMYDISGCGGMSFLRSISSYRKFI